MSASITVECDVCEGTGRELNRFDPPVNWRDSLMDRELLVLDDAFLIPRSRSGWEIYSDRLCLSCHGRGRFQLYRIGTGGIGVLL